MQRAVTQFRQGRQVPALAAALAALDLTVFQYEGVTEEELAEYGVDASEWKGLAVRCVLLAVDVSTACTLFAWQQQVAAILDAQIGAFGLGAALRFTPGQLRPQRRDGWSKPCAEYVPSGPVPRAMIGVPVQTVHAVKGETHDVTVFVCPELGKKNAGRCPSIVWWSDDPADQEEKRIAYVAMTRTRRDLVVCVSNECYLRLSASRAQFVATFECLTVYEFTETKARCLV